MNAWEEERKKRVGVTDSVGGRYGKRKDRDLSEGDGNNVKRGKNVIILVPEIS